MKRALAVLLIVLAAALMVTACGKDTLPTQPTLVVAPPVLTYFYADAYIVTAALPCTNIRWSFNAGDEETRVRIEPSQGDGLTMTSYKTVCPATTTTYTVTATDNQQRFATGTVTIIRQ